MKNSTFKYMACIVAGFLFYAGSLNAQVSFKNSNALLTNPNMHSGCAITVCDMNGDGLDDIVRLNQGHDVYIEYQKPGNMFQSVHIGDLGGTQSEWGMCVADVDHNGYKDILAGGNNGSKIQLMMIDSGGLMLNTIDISTASISGYFMQNANFMDVNNDGWEDIFTCNDNGPSIIWTNDGAGNFTMSNIINFSVHPWTLSTGGHGSADPADAGNYGSVWTDFDNDGDVDLYVAHCRQGVNNNSDPRRIDQLFVNNGNGTYTQMDTVFGVADSLETWTASFGDIDNDGDFDLLLTEQDDSSRILVNDGAGHLADIASPRLPISQQTIESVMEDFDNDGFIDILVTGANSQLFHNNGNSTFTEIPNPFDNNGMESFAIGDLNHDGKIDLYAGYGGIYTSPSSVNDVVWLNTTNNNNNFLTFHLRGTTSNRSALGAKAVIYGSWGKQVREVRSGESYGTCNSSDLHFGLGTSSTVDSAIIRWPSGSVTRIVNPTINQFITVIEDSCISPDNIVTANGSLTICPGQSVTLNAEPGHNYLWTDGSTTQSIIDSTAGDIAVTISDPGNSCTSTSAIKTVVLNPDETPTVSTSTPDLNICQGSTVTLTSSPAISYLWSNGDVTQSTVINQTGNYTVTIQGLCQQWTSQVVAVNVYPAPAPVANTVMIPVPGNAVLTATGNHVSWYNVAVGGTPLDTGLTFTTPFLNYDSVFYAEDSYSYGGAINFTGEPYHTGNDYSGTTVNNYEIFDVLNPCILKTVKVYTDTSGDRLIELRDYNDVVLQSTMVNIPLDSSDITLNFNLVPGISYHLATNSAQNNSHLGFISPRLKRSDNGVNYPYSINNFLTINTSSGGSAYYYYFYDWQVVEPPTVCESDRIPVNVIVISTGINNINFDDHIKLYPNPSMGNVNVSFDENTGKPTTINISDLTGRIISHNVYEQISAGQTIHLDLGKIASGAYEISINNENASYTRRITIMQ